MSDRIESCVHGVGRKTAMRFCAQYVEERKKEGEREKESERVCV